MLLQFCLQSVLVLLCQQDKNIQEETDAQRGPPYLPLILFISLVPSFVGFFVLLQDGRPSIEGL